MSLNEELEKLPTERLQNTVPGWLVLKLFGIKINQYTSAPIFTRAGKIGRSLYPNLILISNIN